jgi:dTDP-glucose 4,6-dehydratase
VISLAGVTNVDTALENPELAFRANIGIAIDLVEWLRLRPDRPRVVYISTDEVLGESWVALPEDAALKPTQPYAASKAAAELILHNYRDVYGLDVVTLRSCNLIGGQQRARKLIPVAVASLLEARPVPIYGRGTQMREWLAVEDLCDAVLAVLGRGVPSGVYQAASGVHLSVHEVVRIVAEAMGRTPKKIEVRDRPVHDRCYAMQSCRLRNYGWAPAIDPRHAIAAAARELASVRDLDTSIRGA